MHRVLLVEDEFITSLDIAEDLSEHGFEVIAAAYDIEEAERLASFLEFDAAVVDVNLHGRPVFEALRPVIERGKPFVFVSGQREVKVPDWVPSAPLIPKPVDTAQVARTLRCMLG